ncbi:MAG: hypothetical protein AAFY82_10195, partial [Pseudomonadota bacterium]
MSEPFPTPCFVLDLKRLRSNLETARHIRESAGCKILLATKAFALPAVFPLMRDYLDGTTASGEQEARLGADHFGKEVHVYSPAYAPGEVERLSQVAQHIYFNSAAQIKRFGGVAKAAGATLGLRVNPGFSNATLGGDLYDPCAPMSRFGEVPAKLQAVDWTAVDIFHVHALCESLADGSVGLIEHVAQLFAPYLDRVSTVNFGGGHFFKHIRHVGRSAGIQQSNIAIIPMRVDDAGMQLARIDDQATARFEDDFDVKSRSEGSDRGDQRLDIIIRLVEEMTAA